MTSMTAIHDDASSEWTTPIRRRFSTAETWEGLLYRLPFVVMRRSRLNQMNRSAFDLGREYATHSAAPTAALR